MECLSRVRYNMRVLECRLAAMLLAHQLGAADWRSVHTLKGVEQCIAASEDFKHLSLDDGRITAVEHLIKEEPYSQHEVCSHAESSSFEVSSCLLALTSRVPCTLNILRSG